MDTVLLILVAAISLAATWFLCLRPMRRGSCSMGNTAGNGDAKLRREIAELTDEIQVLQAQDVLAEDRPVRRDRDG